VEPGEIRRLVDHSALVLHRRESSDHGVGAAGRVRDLHDGSVGASLVEPAVQGDHLAVQPREGADAEVAMVA